MKILVTGGLGFIGSAVVRRLISASDHEVINIDSMGYAATEGSVADVAGDGRYRFDKLDIRDADAVGALFDSVRPDGVIHLAAESHVDRSIDGPRVFMETNVLGTFNLLEAARATGVQRFHHVSTDEVFGELAMDDPPFTETTPYDPRSPYSASKASSDHIVRAWGETFDLAVLITNCSNNYGPFQFPEKLIPLMTIKAMRGEPLPVYGSGSNVRDWLFVDDHARAIIDVFERGTVAETYNVGGSAERTNLDVVHALCEAVDDRLGRSNTASLIEFVTDRPGHDLRYAIDSSKIERELGWTPSVTFEQGLAETVGWYHAHEQWWAPLIERSASIRRGSAG